jgi:NTE family protein
MPPQLAPARRSPNTVLAVAALGVFMAFVDATVVNIAFPQIARDFHGTPIASLQWIVDAYNIVFAALLITSGRLADLIGRRRMFLIGLAVFTAASGLCAIAPSVGALIAMRALQAVGASMLVPASLALVLDAFDEARRQHAVAMWAAVAALAAGLGPTLGGLLVTTSSWRLVFVINLPIGVAAAILARRLLHESRSPGARRSPDVIGAAILAGAVGSLVLAIVQGGAWGWTSARVFGAGAAGILLSAVFVHRCLTRRDPLVDLRMFANRSCSAANAATLLCAAGFFGFTLVNVLFLTNVWHYSVLRAGLAITPAALIVAVVAGPSSRLVSRFGQRAVAVTGTLIWAGAAVWLATEAGLRPDYLGQWLPGLVLAGIGGGLAFPTLSSAAITSAAGQDFGTSTAVNSVARQLGAALGVAIAVAALGTPVTPAQIATSFDHAWTVAAVLLGAGAVLALGLGRSTAPAPSRALGVAADAQAS